MNDSPPSMVYHVTLLINPLDKKPFFVLLTDSCATRFSGERCHFEDEEERRLIEEIVGDGPEPSMVVLENVVGKAQAQETKRFWVAFLLARRIPLFNKTDGWLDTWRFERMTRLAIHGDKDSAAVQEPWFIEYQAPPLVKAGDEIGEQIAKVREKHPRAYEPWSEEEDAFVERSIEAGITTASIAAKLQRRRGAVSARMKKRDNPE